MNGIVSFVGQLFWAIVGALLSVWLPFLVFWLRQRRRPRLLGVWESTYEGIDEPPGTWVHETVEISVSRGKLKFKNDKSDKNYDYTAFGAVKDMVFIVGEWESIRPGANAKGAFMLTVSSQGNAMYGYWCGPDKTGSRRYGKWVLGRTAELVEMGKQLSKDTTGPADVHA